MNKQMASSIAIALFLLAGCSASAQTSTPVPTTTLPKPTPAPELKPPTYDVPYVIDGVRRQRLDVFLPEGEDGPFPTIIAIHGGGFRSGSKALYYDLANHFNELGYALVTINFRFTPDFIYPAQVQDAFCALAWVHANAATYGFDKEHIVALGVSAGGYLAAMLGTVDTPSIYMEDCPNQLPQTDWIQGVVAFYGGYDLTSIDGITDTDLKNTLEPFWGTTFDKVPAETLAEMSPLSWVEGSEPSFLIIHGTNDPTIPSWDSENFASALEDSGATVELLLLDAGHAFFMGERNFPPAYEVSLEAIEAWLAALFEG